jgi:hypothetical protein
MPKLSTLAILAGLSIIGFAQETVFRVPVRVVTVPTAVVSPGGQFVRGLQPYEFRLFDNDRGQNLHLDYVEEPLSLAIVASPVAPSSIASTTLSTRRTSGSHARTASLV